MQICRFMHHNSISEEIFRRTTIGASKKAPTSRKGLFQNFLVERISRMAAVWGLKKATYSATGFLQNFLDKEKNWDTTQFLKVMHELRGFSLIDFEIVHKTFSIHPLTHAWICDAIIGGKKTCALTQAMLAMSINWEYGSNDLIFRQTLLSHIEMA